MSNHRKATGPVAASFERLEERRLLAAITGGIFNDLDTSRTYSKNEPTLPGITVFLDDNRNGQIDAGERTTTSDANGNWFFKGLDDGVYYVGQTLPTGFNQISPGAAGSGPAPFTISLRNGAGGTTTGVTASQLKVLNRAAKTWESIIIGSVPAALTDLGITGGIVIDVSSVALDGRGSYLGAAQPTQVRSDSMLPARGELFIDSADAAGLESTGNLYDVGLQEIAHTLGFGTLWKAKGLLVPGRFVGPKATAEYNKIFDRLEPGVPLQATGPDGIKNAKFSEAVLNDELMTTLLSPQNLAGDANKLSRITVASFADLGYDVDDSAGATLLSRGSPVDPTYLGSTLALQDRPTNVATVGDINSPGGPDAAAALGYVPFEQTVLVSGGEDVTGVLFANRLNTGPAIGAFNVSPQPVEIGQNVTLRAGALSDAEGDRIRQVTFYVESNGAPGLQTGAGGDTYIANDDDFATGGFRADAATDALSAGQNIFYARAADEFAATTTRVGVVTTIDPQALPATPTSVRINSTSATTATLTWKDNATNELGYQVQFSTGASFPDGATRTFRTKANVKSLVLSGLNPGVLYFYRVRAFNTAGQGTYAGGVSARQQTASTAIVDNTGAVNLKGAWATISDAPGFFQTDYLTDGNTGKSASKGKTAQFVLNVPVDGKYFVYGQWTQDSSNASNVPYTFTNGKGDTQTLLIDQSRRGGGWVLLGQFEFTKAGVNSVTLSTQSTNGQVIADAVQILPAGDTAQGLSASGLSASDLSVSGVAASGVAGRRSVGRYATVVTPGFDGSRLGGSRFGNNAITLPEYERNADLVTVIA